MHTFRDENGNTFMHPIQAITDARKTKFNFGDLVHSIAITKQKDRNVLYPEDVVTKDAFDGVVTYVFINGRGDVCYHVLDDAGNYWHRKEREISALEFAVQQVAA